MIVCVANPTTAALNPTSTGVSSDPLVTGQITHVTELLRGRRGLVFHLLSAFPGLPGRFMRSSLCLSLRSAARFLGSLLGGMPGVLHILRGTLIRRLGSCKRTSG